MKNDKIIGAEKAVNSKRRAMLGRIGLLAVGLYTAPALVHLSEAKASSGGSGGEGRGRTSVRRRGDSSPEHYRSRGGRDYYRTRRGEYRTHGGTRFDGPMTPPAN